ncbi:MAG: HEAT repeat domain-containing protein [Candidatus Omnitrophota bacterium]|jgi:HEAT repeat protein
MRKQNKQYEIIVVSLLCGIHIFFCFTPYWVRAEDFSGLIFSSFPAADYSSEPQWQSMGEIYEGNSFSIASTYFETPQAVDSGINNLPSEPDKENPDFITNLTETDVAVAYNINRLLYDDTPGASAEAATMLGILKDPRSVPALSQTLCLEGESETRIASAEALGRIQDPSALPALTDNLFNKGALDHEQVRLKTVWAIAQMGEEGFAVLEEALNSGKPSRMQTAAWAFRQLGEESVPTLIHVVQESPVAEGRKKAAETLGTIGDARGVPALTEAMQDTSPEVRETSAAALGKIKDSRALPALIEGLNDEQPAVRKNSAEALGKINDPSATTGLIGGLTDGDPAVRAAAAKALGEIKNPEAIDALLGRLGDDRITVCDNAAQSLVNIGDTAVSPLIQLLTKPTESRTKEKVLWTLGEIKNPDAVPVLIQALNDPDTRVTNAAVDAIKKIGEEAVRGLMKAASDGDIQHRKTAIVTLGKMEDSLAAPVVISALNDENPEIQRAAACTLGEIKDISAGPALLRVMENNTDAKVKQTTAWALGEIHYEPAADSLIKELKTGNSSASDALQKIGAPAVAPLLKELPQADDDLKTTIEDTIYGMKSESIQPLIDVFAESGTAPVVLDSVALLLIRQGQPAMEKIMETIGCEPLEAFSYRETIQNLVNFMNNNEFSTNIKILLAKFSTPAVEPLIAALDNPALREDAKDTLIMLGNQAFIPVLTEKLNSADAADQEIGREIITGIAQNKIGETGIDPAIDLSGIAQLSQQELENIALTNEYSVTRAVALYTIGTKYNGEEFLKTYVFDENPEDGKLTVTSKDISKLEMAAILNTGIPSQEKWWESLSGQEIKTDYIKLVLKGDFTDERVYILTKTAEENNRAWVCVQYSTQLVMNSRGYSTERFGDKESFIENGQGYIIPIVSYGIPLHYATSGNILIGHAFNAVFIGDGAENDKIEDWLFIEPMDDDFSPNYLGEEILIHKFESMVLLPDGEWITVKHPYDESQDVTSRGGAYQNVDLGTIKVQGYQYGSDI